MITWVNALKKLAEVENNLQLAAHSQNMIKAIEIAIYEGVMTKEISNIVFGSKKVKINKIVSNEEFIEFVSNTLLHLYQK